mgnify:CR=1 FL=1
MLTLEKAKELLGWTPKWDINNAIKTNFTTKKC